jgi:hypothetical protein
MDHAAQHRPLGSYFALTAAFNALAAAGLVAAHRAGRLPERFAAADLALAGFATYRVARLLARDRVTSFLRAPFTRFEDDAGHGEVEESARGRGPQRALGELMICPNCLSLWVAASFTGGLIGAPRVTRAVAAGFTVEGIADALELAAAAAHEKV